MTKPKPPHTPYPRFYSEYQVATRLGKSESWLTANRKRLELTGFPVKDKALGLTDVVAVEHWINMRSGIKHGDVQEAHNKEIMEAING